MSLISLFVVLFTGLFSCGARECTSPITRAVAQTRYETVTSTYSYGCEFLWWRICRRTRVRIISVQVYQIQTVAVNTECCDGYTRSNNGACLPVCHGGCGTRQYCIAPNTCTCIDDGYTGDNCDQSTMCINCVQPRVCIAPATCQCERGFTGPDCQDDIDECEAMNNAGCEQICLNRNGSFMCVCEEGFSLGLDRGRCVGSVNLTLVTVNSSSLMAVWHYPVWDSEKLTTSYNLTCSNGSNDTTIVSVVILNNTNTSDTISELIVGLDTDGGYQCCVTVRTSNGDGPPSCTVLSGQVTMATTMTTPASNNSGLGIQQEAVTNPQNEDTVDKSVVFQAGMGSGAAGFAILLALCAAIICCILCARYRSRKRDSIALIKPPSVEDISMDTDRAYSRVEDIPYNRIEDIPIDTNQAYSSVTDTPMDTNQAYGHWLWTAGEGTEQEEHIYI